MSKVRLVKIWTDQTFDQKIRRFLKNDENHKCNEDGVEVDIECINDYEEEGFDGSIDYDDAEKRCSLCWWWWLKKKWIA